MFVMIIASRMPNEHIVKLKVYVDVMTLAHVAYQKLTLMMFYFLTLNI